MRMHMKKEQIQEFTIRISQSNRTGIIVIMYEILMVYLQDAIDATDYESFKKEVKNAQKVIRELTRVLNFDYEISYQFAAIYNYINCALSKAVILNSSKELPRLKGMVEKFHHTYEEVAAQDDSTALMRNTQQVYAGLTYGKGTLKEIYEQEQPGGSRGYFA